MVGTTVKYTLESSFGGSKSKFFNKNDKPCELPKRPHAWKSCRFSLDFPKEDLLISHCFTATVQKIVTEILPPSSGLVFGKDARDLLIECCVEFITLISSEANDISEKESKKTIACDHITKALEQLGFGAYVQEIMEVANEHKEQLKECRFLVFDICFKP
jgi:histone H3/H4